MSALDCVSRLEKTAIPSEGLRFCLVNEKKNPFKMDGTRAATNRYEDFVSFEEVKKVRDLDKWPGLGISIQASDVIGIDLDHCVEKSLDYSTANEQAKEIISIFSKFAYVEFSFSGKGIRILFRNPGINPYKEKYYIKNSSIGVEFYQPLFDNVPSNRFVTITGNTIINNPIDTEMDNTASIRLFLDKYMKRKEVVSNEPVLTDSGNDGIPFDKLMLRVRTWYLKDFGFQEDWFHDGVHPTEMERDESERDYRITEFLFTHVTQDETMLKRIFEESPFFKTKDSYHMRKWNRADYFDKYLYGNIKRKYEGKERK